MATSDRAVEAMRQAALELKTVIEIGRSLSGFMPLEDRRNHQKRLIDLLESEVLWQEDHPPSPTPSLTITNAPRHVLDRLDALEAGFRGGMDRVRALESWQRSVRGVS